MMEGDTWRMRNIAMSREISRKVNKEGCRGESKKIEKSSREKQEI
jgi:hypothetical protein